MVPWSQSEIIMTDKEEPSRLALVRFSTNHGSDLVGTVLPCWLVVFNLKRGQSFYQNCAGILSSLRRFHFYIMI